VLFLATGLVAALSGGMGYRHYFRMAYPALALVAGLGVGLATGMLGRRWAWATLAAVALAAVVWAVSDRLGQWRSRRWEGYMGEPTASALARAASATGVDDTLFVWGIHPDFYVSCRRVAATRFTSCGWLVGTFTGEDEIGDDALTAAAWSRLFADLEEHPPALVIDSAPAGVHGFQAFPMETYPDLVAWRDARYRFAGEIHGYRFYARRRG
jgi:hypothetical protein